MGSYTFKWENPADEVYVTGTFDDWTKSVKLDKLGDIFKKSVFFIDSKRIGSQRKIYYKYVVDGVWTTNDASPKEADHEGNVNNFIAPEDMASEEPAAAVIQTVTADSTTTELAGQQPIEKKESEATPSDVPHPSGDQEQTFSVNPLPAAIGAVNPFHLAPGEPVPAFATQDLNKYVKLDEASYEKSDALPGIEASELQPPSFEGNVIPESGLPMADATTAMINTVGSTTLGLAANVPLEPKVPDVVKESQEEAVSSPEAAAIPEEVQEKVQVEEQTESKVSEAPAVEETVATAVIETPDHDAGVIAGAAVVAVEETPVEKEEATLASDEAAVIAAAETTAQEIPETAQEPLIEHKEEEQAAEAAPEVPEVVKESVPEPTTEAVATTTVIEEKNEVEPEVLKEAPQEEAKSEEAKVEAAKAEETKVEELKFEETKVEEVPPAPVVTEAPEPEAEKTQVAAIETSAEVTKTEAPEIQALAAEPAAEPAAESAELAAVEAPKPVLEPESTMATQVDDSAEVVIAAERPHVEIPASETPKSERTEVSPTAEAPQADTQANGAGKHGDTPSDKKRKNRLSGYFNRIKARLFL